jgi:hypothetical protein
MGWKQKALLPPVLCSHLSQCLPKSCIFKEYCQTGHLPASYPSGLLDKWMNEQLWPVIKTRSTWLSGWQEPIPMKIRINSTHSTSSAVPCLAQGPGLPFPGSLFLWVLCEASSVDYYSFLPQSGSLCLFCSFTALAHGLGSMRATASEIPVFSKLGLYYQLLPFLWHPPGQHSAGHVVSIQ